MVPYLGDIGKAGKYAAKAKQQMKRLSKGEIKAFKQKIGDVHKEKINSRQDLFKDSEGNIYSFPKNGDGPGNETGYSTDDLW